MDEGSSNKRLIRRSVRGRGVRGPKKLIHSVVALAVILVAAPSGATTVGPKDGDVPRVVSLQRVSGKSPLPKDCGDPGGAAIIDSEVEVHLAVNPSEADHLLASWQQDRYSEGNAARSNVVAVSRDGGDTWTAPSAVPGISTCSSDDSPYDRATDPWGAIGPDGTAYLSTLAVNNNVHWDEDDAVYVSASPDGGESWIEPPAILQEGEDFLEKPELAADPVHAGRAYSVWFVEEQDAVTGERLDDHMRFAMTDDHGAMWTDPVTIPPDDPVDWEQPRDIIPIPRDDGGTSLVVVYQTEQMTLRGPPGVGPTTIWSVRSEDLGEHWTEPSEIATFVKTTSRGDPEEIVGIDVGVPSAARAPDGTLYVSWSEDIPVGSAPGGSDIRVARSDDGGDTWTTTTVASFDNSAFLPTVAAAKDGTVGVFWYDLRNDVLGDDELTTDVWFASSVDRAESWQEMHLAGPFDLRQGPRDGGGFRHFLGDYAAMVGLPNGFGVLFPMAPPKAIEGPSDVFFAKIQLLPPQSKAPAP